MVAAIALPLVLVLLAENLDALADMYAIGVVGAITVNIGSACFNKRLQCGFRSQCCMPSSWGRLRVFARMEITGCGSPGES